MTIPLIVAILAGGAALMRGGSLERLAATKFRWLPLLFAALVVQIGFSLWEPPWLTEAGALAIVLGSMVGVAVFLTINQHLPGTVIAAVGLALNVLVIGTNGAMPVSPDAARIAGVGLAELEDGGIKHEVMTDDTRLTWLGDVIPIPRWGLIISVGDVVLAAGLGLLTYKQTLQGPGPGAPRDTGSRRKRVSRRPERDGGSRPGAPPAPPPSPRRPG